MPITANILDRRVNSFLVWSPLIPNTPPDLIIGQLKAGNPPVLLNVSRYHLAAVAGATGLYEVAAGACNLTPGNAYHYWFEVDDTRTNPTARIAVTDPFACSIDWRVFSPHQRQSLNQARQLVSSAPWA